MTANKLAPSVPLLARRIQHKQCASMQTVAAGGRHLAVCVCEGNTETDAASFVVFSACGCKRVVIFTASQSVEARAERKHAFPRIQPSRLSYGNNKIKNNNSNQRNLHSNVKEYKVHFNYSKSRLNYSLGFKTHSIWVNFLHSHFPTNL